MAEVKCTKCGNPMAAKDKFCPACGHPAGKKSGGPRRSRSDHLIILGVLAAVVIIYVGYQALSPRTKTNDGHNHSMDAAVMPPDMQTFIQNLPSEFESLVSMGNALMDQKHFAMAIECYQRALDQKPEDVNVRVDMGTCQHSLDKGREAIATFEKALEYDSSHHIAKFNLGIVYYTSGDMDHAVDWWERLLAEDPPLELKDRTEELLRQVQGY